MQVRHPPRYRVPSGCRSSLKKYGDHHVQERIPRRLRLRKASLSAGFGSLEILGFRLDASLLQCSNRIATFDWFISSICYSGPQKGASISGQHWKLGDSRLNARVAPARELVLGEIGFLHITVHRPREGSLADITR